MEKEKLVNKDKKNYLFFMIKELIDYNRKIVIESIFFTISFIIFNVINIYIIKIFIDLLQNRGDLKIFIILSIVYVFISGLTGYMSKYLLSKSRSKISGYRMTKFSQLTSKVNNADYINLENPIFQGDLESAMTGISNNADGLEGILQALYQIIPYLLIAMIYMFFLAKINLLIPILIFLNNIFLYYIEKRSSKIYRKSQNERSQLLRQKNKIRNITYDFNYGKDIRIYNLASLIKEEILIRFERIIYLIKNYRYKGLKVSILGFFSIILTDFYVFYLLIQNYKESLIISNFIVSISLVSSLAFVLYQVQGYVSIYYNNKNYVESYYEFIEKDYGKVESLIKIDKNHPASIRFENVWFKYPKSDDYILEDINLNIKAGEKVGIVGSNGAGKTTLIKLMTGLLSPSKGDIYINEINIKKYGKLDLHQIFNVVFQQVNIYAFTVLENIAMDYENIDEDKVMYALNLMGLSEKIESFPKKENQSLLKVIDEDGKDLSGGERQKLAIARALYKGGQIMILDEPTAALDAINESEIYEKYNELVDNKTSIFISHRLASTKFTDRIILLDKKGIKEEGTHMELIDKQGLYYEMFMIQSKYYREKEDEEQTNNK